jgi:transcriptional regulator with XRE-family HTH domain
MDTPARAAIARNVKALRQRLSLSQAKLSQKCGVAQTAISYLERLGTKSPTLDVLEALAKAFRVPVWTLLLPIDGLDAEQIREFATLCEQLLRLPPEGRREVLRTAEREVRYSSLAQEKINQFHS